MKIHDVNNLSQFYYVAARRIEMRKKDLMEATDKMPRLVTEEGDIVSFFCNIHYPIVKHEVYIRLYLDDIDELINVKLVDILNIHLAGWPRAGKMAEMYTDFPWRLLKPVYEYLTRLDKPEALIKSLYDESGYDNQPTTKRCVEELYTYAHEGLNKPYESDTFYEWLSKLKDIYESIVQSHKAIMLEAFSKSAQAYPYLGVIVNKKHLKTDTYNPFIEYLDVCIENQNKILGKI